MPRSATTQVSLNVDLGELAEQPEVLFELATVVNVACGGHAGDVASMTRAVTLARASGVVLAAHPSYPDRAGFGRVSLRLAAIDLAVSIAAQCQALQAVADGEVATVKLHGALYHDAARDPVLAAAVIAAVAKGLGRDDVTWVGPGEGALQQRAHSLGLAYLREGFADRGYTAEGALIARGQAGALIEDPDRAAEQALGLARGGKVDTICVHSDTAGAVAIARAVRAALQEAGLLRTGAR